MKKHVQLLLVVVTLMFLNLNSASAFTILNNWYLDASDFGGGTSGPIERILFQSPIAGSTEIIQDLGGNGQVDNGDTFNETLWMSANQFNQTGVAGAQNLNLGGGNSLLIVVAASGEVVNYVDDSDYGYTLSGAVEFYIDDDQDWSAFSGNLELGSAPTLVATAHITSSGQAGTADGFLGSLNSALSNWAVSFEFDGMYADMWKDLNGDDLFTTYPGVVGDAQGVTRLSGRTYNPDQITPESITFRGSTGDDMLIGVVPEPSTLILFGLGLLSVAGIGRRKFE